MTRNRKEKLADLPLFGCSQKLRQTSFEWQNLHDIFNQFVDGFHFEITGYYFFAHISTSGVKVGKVKEPSDPNMFYPSLL